MRFDSRHQVWYAVREDAAAMKEAERTLGGKKKKSTRAPHARIDSAWFGARAASSREAKARRVRRSPGTVTFENKK